MLEDNKQSGQNGQPESKHLKQVRYQTLCEGEYHEGKLFILKRGWLLRLQLSSELVHKSLRVFCNIPPLTQNQQQPQKFSRSTFYEYAWSQPAESLPHDDFNHYVEIECHLPGSFRYYFIYANESTGMQKKNNPGLIQTCWKSIESF